MEIRPNRPQNSDVSRDETDETHAGEQADDAGTASRRNAAPRIDDLSDVTAQSSGAAFRAAAGSGGGADVHIDSDGTVTIKGGAGNGACVVGDSVTVVNTFSADGRGMTSSVTGGDDMVVVTGESRHFREARTSRSSDARRDAAAPAPTVDQRIASMRTLTDFKREFGSFSRLVDQRIASMRTLVDVKLTFHSISLMDDENEQPVKLKKAAEHLANLLGSPDFLPMDEDRRAAYRELVKFTHHALHWSKAGNADAYAETFAVIAKLSKQIPTDDELPQGGYLGYLVEDEEMSLAHLEVTAKAVLDALHDAPEAARAQAFLLLLSRTTNIAPGQRASLLEAMASNLDRYPTDGGTSGVPRTSIARKLIGLSTQERTSCEARVRTSIARHSKASGGGFWRGLLGS